MVGFWERGLYPARRLNSRPSRCQVTTLGKLFTRMGLCRQTVQFGTSRGAAMSCDWEGNRRSAAALAMRHRLKWFIHLRVQGLSKGDEHPTSTPHWGMVLFTFITFCVSRRRHKMYCGHARLCVSVCLCVCLSVRGRTTTLLHGPGCNLGAW